ncbi:MAG: hypothetical protein EAZ20_03645 [Bacteroidetes bacterium]|nr:MAG: hypothetical protein EAZ20_03645 [Bacteroidota bacterium]
MQQTSTNYQENIYLQNFQYFILFCGIYIVIMLLYQDYIFSDTLYHNSLSEQMSYTRIDEMLQLQKKWAFFGYIILPLALIIRMTFTSLCMLTGAIIYEYKVSFARIFKIVLVSEVVYLLPLFLKFFYFMFLAKNYTLTDLQNFDVFSLLALFDINNLDKWLIYPLSCINIIELLYILVLSYHLRNLLNKNFNDSFNFVINSYGIGLVLWVTFITFVILHIIK